MPPPPHNFRSYFTLTNNPNNAIAMYNCYIRKYGRLGIAQLKPECCTVNRARLYCTYLLKYEAFRKAYTNDLLWFEQLLLRMIVSNALPFAFVENEDTIAMFEFLIPGLKLPKRKVIGGKVLMKSVQLLQENIIKTAQSNTNRIIGMDEHKTRTYLGCCFYNYKQAIFNIG
ncbi:22788_t:CDS:2, partial [Gigaspora margarita]